MLGPSSPSARGCRMRAGYQSIGSAMVACMHARICEWLCRRLRDGETGETTSGVGGRTEMRGHVEMDEDPRIENT